MKTAQLVTSNLDRYGACGDVVQKQTSNCADRPTAWSRPAAGYGLALRGCNEA